MATLAEVLGGQQNPTVNVSENALQGVKAGIGLATAKEQVEAVKAQTEAMKAELISKQASTANSLLTNLARANPVVAKQMLKGVREKLLNLGVDPNVADYTVSDDAARQRQIGFSQFAAGKLTSDPKFAGEYFASLADLVGYDQAAQMFDNELKRRQQDKALAVQERGANARLKMSLDKEDEKQNKEVRGALTKMKDKFNSEMKKETDALTSMQSAKSLIAQGGVAASAGRRALAKAFNSGAMTDQDVADIAGGKSLLQKANQLAETAMTGNLTPENEAELINIAETLIPAMQAKISDRAESAKSSFKAIYPEVPDEQILSVLNPTGISRAGISITAAEKTFIDNAMKAGASEAQAMEFLKAKKSQAKK